MLIGVGSVVLGMAVGVPLGVVAGFLGGKVERIIMWVVDVFLAFPRTILALLFVAIFGGSLWSVLTAIAIGVAPGMVRIAHGPAMGLRSSAFVLASVAFGAGPLWMMRKHLWPSIRAEMLGAGNARSRVQHRGHGRAELSRPQPPGAGCYLGRRNQGRYPVPAVGAAVFAHPRNSDPARRIRVQPIRRRTSRLARPA